MAIETDLEPGGPRPRTGGRLTMRRLAEAFAGLETTRSRTQMVQILAELFREAAPDDLAEVLYLTQGRLRSAYEAVEIGLGEQTMLRVLAAAYQTPAARVAQVAAETGDVGLAAERLNPRDASELAVAAVYAELLEVAGTAGRGSTERRVARLEALFSQLGGREARYVARVCVGRLRLGVGDATLLDGLAAAFAERVSGAGDAAPTVGTENASGPPTPDTRHPTPVFRRLLERAYHLRPDLGWLGETLATQGLEALERARPEPGVPILPALAERLPSSEAIIERLGPCQVEPKYDGLRVQLHRDGDRVWLFSRRLENLTGMLPEVVAAAPEQLVPVRCIVEGEALVYNPETEEFLPFQITAQRRRKHGVEAMTARYPVRLFLFDLMLQGEEDFTPRPLRERREALVAAVRPTPNRPIDVTRAEVIGDAPALERFFEESIATGLEGIMAKRLDAAYHAGARSSNWVKLKRSSYSDRGPRSMPPLHRTGCSTRGALTDTVDAVIVGYLLGRGGRARLGIGSLLVAVYDAARDEFATIARVGSGLSEDGWVRLRELLDPVRAPQRPARVVSRLVPDVWVEPTYVVEVQADEITRSPVHTAGLAAGESGLALRFPRIVGGLRADKQPEDATTVAEIVGMYDQQLGATCRRPL